MQLTPDLQQRYASDSEFALSVRQLAVLALVPVSDVSAAFNDLMDSHFYQTNSDILGPLVNYFEDTCIGRPCRRGRIRMAQMFAQSLWNCYEASLDDLIKTNNSVEGWHRGSSHLLSAHQPTIWKFISGLKKDQSLMEL